MRRSLNRINVDLREPLPLGFARSDRGHSLEDTIAKTFDAVARELASQDNEEVARSERIRIHEARRQPDTLRAQLGAFAITDETRLRRVLDFSLRVVDDRVFLEGTNLELRMPISALEALRVLLANAAITISQFTGLNEASRLVLARRLLREDVVEIVAD